MLKINLLIIVSLYFVIQFTFSTTMDKIIFEHSAKNIPLGENKVYLEMLIQAIEKFSRNISWRCFFKLNPELKSRAKEYFGFNSTRAPPRILELKEFEEALAKLLRNIKFRKRSNPFLAKLKDEIKKINKQKNMIIPADKTSNNYLVPPTQYEKLLAKEVQKDYKLESEINVRNVNSEHGATITELGLGDRVFTTVPRNAFISLKDHKENFENNPQCRLLNPTKPEIGRIAMKIVDNMVKTIRNKGELVQWTNTRDVVDWFKGIKNKKVLKFIQFDIVSFYPSITPTLLDEALTWAAEQVDLSPQQRTIIFQARKSFLYTNGKPWVKKGDKNFDVGMGSYDGAQICELVGLLVLSQMKHIPDFNPKLYRDDGLGPTSASIARQKEIREELIRIFSENNLNKLGLSWAKLSTRLVR